MRTRARALSLALALLVIPGCLGPAVCACTPPPPEVVEVVVPSVDARATLDALKVFAEAFPYRQSGTPTHLGARDWLADALAGAGLDVLRQSFPASLGGGGAMPYDGENVIGIKWGEVRDRWVVVGAHYDITEGAVHGAYDDGSGTLLTLKLAEAFAKIPTNRTIAFVFFDQEELGLVGSRYFVESVTTGTFEHAVTIDAMIDLDMVGIMHPHPAPLVVWESSDALVNFVEAARKAVGVPDEKMSYREPRYGSSDGAVFIQAGIPTVYFMSNWDEIAVASSPTAGAPYPFWHQADTYETMLAMAGSEETLEAGFQNILDIVAPVLARAASPEFQPTDA